MSEPIDWREIRKFAKSTEKPPPEWPDYVTPISLEGLGLLGLDSKHRLYWDGEPVEVRKTVVLTWWQNGLAIAVALSTVVAAWITYSEYACKVGGSFALLAM